MEYRQIVAITGLPGLYQLLNAQNNGAIVKSLTDKTVSFISSRKHQLTPLESIEIYTIEDNVPLAEVFKKIKDIDAEALEANNKNDKNHYRSLFEKVLPNFDEDRVYASDIKKIFKWYQLLKENDLLEFEQKEEEATVEAQEPQAVEEEAAQSTTKKTSKTAKTGKAKSADK